MNFHVVVLDGPTGPGAIEEKVLAEVGAQVIRLPDQPHRAVADLLATADGVICDGYAVTGALLDQAPRLRIVAEYGIGYDNIDVAAASARGIWVANVPGFCIHEVADHTLALILAANRRIIALDQSTRAGQWDAVGVAAGTQRLSEQTLGLVGFGGIGRLVAKRALSFGMRILVYSPHTTPEIAREHGVERVDLSDLYAQSDYVSLHLPSTANTRDLIDEKTLAQFKPTAWLINTARGSIVNEAALARALTTGRLAGAALDVRSPEPPETPDALRALPNVIITPHAAYYSESSLAELRRRAAGNVAAVLSGKQPVHPVNPTITPCFG